MSTTPPSPGASSSESPGNTLEQFLVVQLRSLDLSVPHDDVEYIARFVEEPDMDRDDKIGGIRGMLEGVVDGGTLPEEGMDEALEAIVEEWERLRSLELQREHSSTSTPSPCPPLRTTDVLSTLTPSELAAAQRQALLRQYAYVDEGPDEEAEIDRDRPLREGLTGEEKKAEEERRRLVAEAIRLDGRKKKHRKKQEVDLLAPNLNRDKMLFKAQAEREAQKKGANDRRERDRLALEKQRGDAAKAKAEKQKKAAKQERRG